MTKTEERIEGYVKLRDEVMADFTKTKDESTDIDIDECDIDTESLRTPSLCNRYLIKYNRLAIELNRLQDLRSKVYLERWKYYQGKQASKYYAEYGPFNEVINKTDVELYLKADDMMIIVDDIIHIAKQHIQYVERLLKEISNRGYHLKTAVEWRRFQSGS